MANFYRFHVTGDYKGGLQVGGTRYVAGDTFDLTQDQVKQFVRWSDVEKGYLLYLGEMPADSTSFSSLVLENLKGKSYTIAKNYLPFAGILSLTGGSVAASGSAGVQGADLCWITLGQRVGVTAIQYRVTTSSGATDANRFLVTAGKVKKVTPTTLRYYDSGSTAYGSMSNGDIDHNAPITWAANDLLIVGYTEKFRSVNVAVDTTRATAGAINQIYYWNGSAWAAFDTFTDYTKEPDGSVSFNRVIADDDSNIRVVWWDAPADWHPGGPAGSGVPAGAYVVAMRISGVLTALNGLRFYPMLDIPIADINVGEGVNEFDAQVTKVAALYTDETGNQTVILDLSTTDYLFLGYAQPWNGMLLSMDAGNVNAVAASDISLSYWNGVAWSGAAAAAAGAWGGTVTDGTEAANITLAQDGIISWSTHPSDWNAVPYTSLDATTAAAFAALGTVTTDSLYWIRVAADDAITATTAVDAIYVIGSSAAWTDATVYNNSTDEQGEFHVHVIDEDDTTVLEIRAVVVDV
jgi:hypothetical protein